MVQVERFCVDRYEAHLLRLSDGGTPVLHPYYERPERSSVYKASSEPGVWPQAYINRPEAQQACEQAGKRLCTVAEWYRACSGPHGWTFPYGETEEAGACNTKKSHLLSLWFGRDPLQWKYREHFNDPRLDQAPGFLGRVGEYARCASFEGAHDMVGNLHEWVSDAVDESLVEKVPLLSSLKRRLGINRGHGIFMGGFFSTDSQHGRGCTFTTIGHEPSYHDYSTGFRCCRDLVD